MGDRCQCQGFQAACSVGSKKDYPWQKRGSPKEVSSGIVIATKESTRCQWPIHSVRCDSPGSSYGYRRRPHGCLTQRTPRIEALMGLQERLPMPTLSRSLWVSLSSRTTLWRRQFIKLTYSRTYGHCWASCQLSSHWVYLCPLHPGQTPRIYCCCSAHHGSSMGQVRYGDPCARGSGASLTVDRKTAAE